jgi:hypothetical protein
MIVPSALYNSKENSDTITYTKDINPKKVVPVIRSEIINVLSNYLKINSDNVYMDIIVNKDGLYELRLRAISSRLCLVNYFSE